MNNELSIQVNQEVIQKLVLDGDISRMNNAQRVSYYSEFCHALGLNPLTQPFQIIKFQGKEKLYATKDCTEQLRKIHGVSITDVKAEELRGVYVVTAKAQDRNGKTDAATGVVAIDNLKGADLANAIMKAETKAKRRVTLSICGLGILDESETDTLREYQTTTIQEALPPTDNEINYILNDAWTYDPWKQDQLERLLSTSTYDSGGKQYAAIEAHIADTNLDEATYWRILKGLQENQQDPVTQRGNHSVTEATRHIKNKVA